MKRKPAMCLPPGHKQGGFFLLPQLGLVVLILAVVMAYAGQRYWQATVNQSRDDRARLVGSRAATVSDATKTYTTTFFTEIQLGQSITRNGYTLPPARILAPTTVDLNGLGFLASRAVNPVIYNGQSVGFSVQITVDTSSGCTVPTCNLPFQVTTTVPLLTYRGNTVDVRRATIAAATASPGNAGVSIPASFGGNPNVFVTSGGTQTGTNPGGVAGLISVSDGYDSQGFLEFLRRDGSLPMTGNLNLQDTTGAKHDIVSAGNVNAVNVTASNSVSGNTVSSTARMTTGEFIQIDGIGVVGQPCQARTIALDANGATLYCKLGFWAAGSSARVQIPVYQCPALYGGTLGGGSWGFYGCTGQITNQPSCLTVEEPNVQSFACSYIGTYGLN